MSRKVTISDIAVRSQASSTTVSMVLRGRPGIGDETRRRVLNAAQTLGYQRRTPASGSDTSSTTIAMILRSRTRVDEGTLPSVNSFYSWVLTGIESAARSSRLNLLYATLAVDDDNQALELPHFLLEQKLGGLLLVGAFSDVTVRQLADESGAPIVLVDGPSVRSSFDAVVSDNEGGAYEAVGHLLAHGHRSIAMLVSRSFADPNFEQRQAGYERAMRDAGLPTCLGRGEGNGVGPERLTDWLNVRSETTAVFACNDEAAIDLIQAARRVGCRVPEDLSVIGFDDIARADSIHPGLTTMAVDKVGMGRLAVMMMRHRLAWPESQPAMTMLRPELRIRSSVGVAYRGDDEPESVAEAVSAGSRRA